MSRLKGPMPAALKCCCGCWLCPEIPETVAVPANSYTISCCEQPNGTFVVGGPRIGEMLSYQQWEYNEHGHYLTFYLNNSVPCTWTWRWIPNNTQNYMCGGDGAVYDGTDFIGYLAKCGGPYITDEYSTIDPATGQPTVTGYRWANVMLKEVILHVLYTNGAKPTDPTQDQWKNRIKVVISRVYHIISCTNQSGETNYEYEFMIVNDEYAAVGVDCLNKPATINHSSRWVSTLGNTFQAVAAQYTFKYDTWEACPPNASVGLTYA